MSKKPSNRGEAASPVPPSGPENQEKLVDISLSVLGARGIVAENLVFEATLNGETVKSSAVGPEMTADFSQISRVSSDLVSFSKLLSSDNKIVVKAADDDHVIGTTSFVNIRPLFLGKVESDEWVPLNMSEPVAEGQEVPALHVKVACSEPLLAPEYADDTNFVTLVMHGVFSVPESFHVKEIPTTMDSEDKSLFSYNISFSLPLNENQDHTFTMTGGRIVAIQEEVVNPDGSTETRVNQMIVWPRPSVEFFLPPEALIAWERVVGAGATETDITPKFSIEFSRIIRVPQEGFEDANANKYRAHSTFDLTPLMRRGVSEHSVQARMHPAPPKSPAAGSESGSVTSSAAGKKATTPAATSKKPAKGKVELPPELMLEPDEPVHPYDRFETSVSLSILMNHPLVPLPDKRPKPDIAPKDLIPARPKPTKKKTDPTEDYHRELGGIVSLLANEFAALYGKPEPGKTVSHNDFARELLSNGKYGVVKERLKAAVSKIARDRLRRTGQISREELETKFLNELYVYLVDQMHTAINKIFGVVDGRGVEDQAYDAFGNPSDKHRSMADEAEFNGDYEVASQHHEHRIATLSQSLEAAAQALYDYGCYLLRPKRNEFNLDAQEVDPDTQLAREQDKNARRDKAEECFREAVARNPTHTLALIGLGVLSTLKGKIEEAEVFLQGACDNAPEDPLPWAVLSLFLSISNRPDREVSYALGQSQTLLANQIASAAQEQQNEASVPNQLGSSSRMGSSSGSAANKLNTTSQSIWTTNQNTSFLLAGRHLITLGATHLARVALDAEIGGTGKYPPRPFPPTPFASIEKRSESRADSNATPSLLNSEPLPPRQLSLASLLLLSDLNMSDGELLKAEEMAVKGLAAVRNKSWEAWRTLAHVQFELGKYEDAEVAYEHVLQQNPTCRDALVFSRLAHVFVAQQKWEDAKDVFLLAARVWPCCMVWFGAGKSFLRIGDFEHAEESLNEANIMDNRNPEVWALLALTCYLTSRQGEGDEALFEATNCGLRSVELLRELADIQMQQGRAEQAEQTLRIAVAALTPQEFDESSQQEPAIVAGSVPLWRMIGDCLLAQERLDEAQQVFKNVLDASESEEDRVHALEQLSRLAAAAAR